jgi:hypothetical protein
VAQVVLLLDSEPGLGIVGRDRADSAQPAIVRGDGDTAIGKGVCPGDSIQRGQDLGGLDEELLALVFVAAPRYPVGDLDEFQR